MMARAPSSQVSARQLTFLLLVMTFPMELLALGWTLIHTAGQDATWAVIFAALLATVAWWVALLALRRDATHGLVAGLKLRSPLFGTVLGVLLPLAIAVPVALHVAMFIQVLHTFTLPNTPTVVLALLLATAVLYLVRGGLESVARVVSLAVPVGLGILLVLVGLAVPFMDVRWIMPFTPGDVGVISVAAWAAFSYLSEIVMVSVLGSYVRLPFAGVTSASLLALGVNALTLLVAVALPLLMFGPRHSAQLVMPTLTAVSDIHYGFLLQRLDTPFTVLWIALTALKLAVWIVLASQIMEDGLRLPPTIWPGLAMVVASLAVSLGGFHSVPDVARAISAYWTNLAAPLIILAIASTLLVPGRTAPA